MIRARITNPAGRERELARLSSCSRCPALNTYFACNTIATYLWDITLGAEVTYAYLEAWDSCVDCNLARNCFADLAPSRCFSSRAIHNGTLRIRRSYLTHHVGGNGAGLASAQRKRLGNNRKPDPGFSRSPRCSRTCAPS